MRPSTALISILLLVASGSANAQQSQACIRPDGTLRIATIGGDCASDETPMTSNALGSPAGAVGGDGQDTLGGLPGTHAAPPRGFDATGAEVGLFMDLGNPAEVPPTSESRELFLSPSASREPK